MDDRAASTLVQRTCFLLRAVVSKKFFSAKIGQTLWEKVAVGLQEPSD